MPGPSVQRTIVKSQPEIWSEVSDATSLARHLGGIGEITITRVTPETAVAWEGDRVRGTVTLERSGWGTKVTVTAETEEGAAAPEVLADVAELEAVEAEEPSEPSRLDLIPPVGSKSRVDERKLRWWQRLRRPRPEAPELVVAPEPALVVTSPPEPIVVVDVEPEIVIAIGPEPDPMPDLSEVLNAMLDHLSAAHHRPFSRG